MESSRRTNVIMTVTRAIQLELSLEIVGRCGMQKDCVLFCMMRLAVALKARIERLLLMSFAVSICGADF